jgi:hypothetical protein
MVPAKIKIAIIFICLSLFTTAESRAGDLSRRDTPYIHLPSMLRYEGDWEYLNDSVSFKLKLKAYVKVYSPMEKRFMDFMVGWYDYEKKNRNGVVKEGTLSTYYPGPDLMRIMLESKGNDRSRSVSFPVIIASDLKNGNLAVSFRRIPANGGPGLNMLATLSMVGSTRLQALFRPGENININHELDHMIEYWEQTSLPSPMILVRSGK